MKWISSIIVALLFISCQEEPKNVLCVGNCELLIDFSCNELTKDLALSQESAIKDLTIYLFHRTQNISERKYITSSHSISFHVPKGEYDVYVIANVGYDLGDRTRSEVENMEITISDEWDLERDYSLLMSDRKTVTITSNTVLSVVLKRMVARIDVNIDIASGFEFDLSSVSVVDAPRSMYYFRDNTSRDGFTYRSHSLSSFSFYILENRQGTNYSISKEQDKNSDAAPSAASYLLIQGTCMGVRAEYRIYLGENNTNNFDVVRNSKYGYHININGINEVDSRVTTTIVSFDAVAESYQVNESIATNVRLESSDSQGQGYSLTVSVLRGNGVVKLNNTAYVNGGSVPFLPSGEQSALIPLSYTQSVASAVQLRLTVTGSDGFSFYRDIFANYVEAPNVLEMTDPVITDSYGGETSYITFRATKKGESRLRLTYELFSGAGVVMCNGERLSNFVSTECFVGDLCLEFTPSVPVDARMKITIESGEETITKTVVVKVYKKVIRHELLSSRILLYIDAEEGAVLPYNSCKEIEVIVELVMRCESCKSIYSVTDKRSEIITPSNRLVTNLGIVYTSASSRRRCLVCSNQSHVGKDEVRFRVIRPIKFYDFIGMELIN